MAKRRSVASGCAIILVLVVAAATIRADLPRNSVASSFLPFSPTSERQSSLKDLRVRAEAIVPRVPRLPYRDGASLQHLRPLPPQLVDDETLWMARCIFSESKRPSEQELVAWVIRNRVETEYRGRNTYRDVVLDPMQFSAFNSNSEQKQFYESLTATSTVPGWQTALRISYEVRWADPQWRPFTSNTRHFYSEQSMTGQKHPDWALGFEPVDPERDYEIEPHRFRFFADVM